MALIKCPECGKEISDQALSCPNCGYSLKKQKIQFDISKIKYDKKIWLGFGICAVVIICLLAVKPIGIMIKDAQALNKIKNDKTPPTLKYSGENVEIYKDEDVTPVLNKIKNQITVSDDVTTIDKLSVKLSEETPLDTSIPGKYFLSYIAIDEAGNEGKIHVQVDVVEKYTPAESAMYETIGTGLSKLEDILKNPKSLDIIGMSYSKDEGTAYYYYSATNGFGGTVTSYCSYTKGDLYIYAPSNNSDDWEILYLKMQYDKGKSISVSEYNEYVRYTY